MEEVRGFHKSHQTPPSGKHLLRYYKRDITMLQICYISRVSGAGDDVIELDGKEIY